MIQVDNPVEARASLDYTMAMEPLPALVTTDRLTIRRWVAGDGAALHAAVEASLEHLRPWMAWIEFEPLTIEDREKLIADWSEQWRAGDDVVLGVFLGDDVVGGTGLHRRIGKGGIEIGYWIHVDHVGRGYATEVASGLTDAAMAIPGIDRVEIHHDRANELSGRIPLALGFDLLGEFPDEVLAPAEDGVECRWGITEAAWRQIRSK